MAEVDVDCSDSPFSVVAAGIAPAVIWQVNEPLRCSVVTFSKRSQNRFTAILECGGMTPLFFRATCRPVPKRGHVRALQIKRSRDSSFFFQRANQNAFEIQ
ncbi:MAG TPA: hypothetical protein VFB72_13040 [Verrucomicrobiae bacterium]|nr:hypothetical protein [Verrucomicrobiae bacterium]